MKFKPMLAETIKDTSALRYPVLASLKLDGVRAMVQGGVLVSRKLLPIPNVNVQKMFSILPEGIDGELLVGDPASKDEDGNSDVFRKTTSVVMSGGKPASDVKFHIFDRFDPDTEFVDRLNYIKDGIELFQEDYPGVQLVQQSMVRNERELLAFEEVALGLGYEGLMVRDPEGQYKQGRATVKQGWLLKLKRFDDSEAEILETHELQHNNNEATRDELGRTKRSSHKAGKVAGGVLGKFTVRDLKSGVVFDVGGGITANLREEFWKNRADLVGQVLKYKFFPVGMKDGVPRFPGFVGLRDKRDM